MKASKTGLLNNPLIVALDVDDDRTALSLCDELSDVAGGFKVGPRLGLRYGADFLREIAKRGPLFVDHKFFDIPNTMETSVRAAFDAGASLVTVHLLAGEVALKRMVALEAELASIRPFKILGVSILTSWQDSDVPSNFKEQPVSRHVHDLLKLGEQCGLSGFVCSGEELVVATKNDYFFVVPGVRLDRDKVHDQKRTLSPQAAIQKGASGIVVGRPIVEASQPKLAALDYAVAWIEV